MNLHNNPDYQSIKSIHEVTVKDIKGELVKLKRYQGHVCIIVNVASQCGLADVCYKQLNQLYTNYAEEKGLRILAFPCNQFGKSEPGTFEDIMRFTEDHGVKFDMFDKVDVNGKEASALWKFLKLKLKEGKTNLVKWNFTKFIINKAGVPVERFGAKMLPLQMEESLRQYF